MKLNLNVQFKNVDGTGRTVRIQEQNHTHIKPMYVNKSVAEIMYDVIDINPDEKLIFARLADKLWNTQDEQEYDNSERDIIIKVASTLPAGLYKQVMDICYLKEKDEK